MSSGLQDAAITSFLQFIEEKGIKVYNSLTKHSCGTSKVSRYLRDEMNLLYRKTKIEWKHREEESKKSICKDGGLGRVRELASFRKHFRVGFMTMPASQDHAPHPCASSMTTRSLSLHSVGSVENGEHPCARRPPAKPRRHPSTKLSLGAEGRNSISGEGLRSKGEKVTQRSGLESTDGGRKIPPLKPRRSPNTQLSVSFDEASVSRAVAMTSLTFAPRYGPPAALRGSDEEEEVEEEEPVYIEMVGDVFKEQGGQEEDSDHSEAIYEEMKYPLLDEGPQELRWSKFALSKPRPPGHSKQGAPKTLHQPASKGTHYDIPPPFPNLLLHRPPLLAFPQAPSQKTYKAAIVSTQPASKLPVLQHADPSPAPGNGQEPGQQPPRGQKEEGASQTALAPSGRARSHSTPLPPQASGQHRPEKLPTSQTMVCPAVKALAHPELLSSAPQVHGHQREKPSSLGVICSSAKVSAHSLLPLPQPSGDQRPDKELSGLQSMLCSVSNVSVTSRPLSGFYKMPTTHGLLDRANLPTRPCTPAPSKRPPAYDSIKPPRVCATVCHATVRTQVQEKGPAFVSVCCSPDVASSEARTDTSPTEGGASIVGHSWQRKLSCSSKAREPEDSGAGIWSGTSESLAKVEKEETSGIPVKTQGLEGSSVKGPARSGLPQPCPISCQRSADSALGHRLGRSASTSGVRHPLAHLQRQCSQSRESPTQPLQQGPREKDGKLLEVIERKRCLCKEIKARRRPERSLCKQDSMPILPSWKKGMDSRKTGTPPCQRQHTVLWDTAI
ncbi:neuronal tyrosine-phosphorylated phosphoinositide-3-kinase adapter 1-like [Heptranchias perlo]|uniref:neuronal tyrosine-phosphorylated phosphoinositide-3-kinase adapter 1-like n=1 Tax=Heptranchias perlo TaxID=212740 RepID=UPI003559D0B0